VPTEASVRLAEVRASDRAPPPSDSVAPVRDRAEAPVIEPLLVPAPEAARLCGVSEATWFRLKAAGKTPAPVKLGRVLYRVEDLKLWVALGCPDRKTFEARKAAENGSDRSR
jgi:predicted DNA-binding transcriptional regulator AlpA